MAHKYPVSYTRAGFFACALKALSKRAGVFCSLEDFHAMRLIIVILTCMMSLGCAATGYHPTEGHITGGYTDLKVGPDMYRISFVGNAYITAEKAYQYTLFRAAEVTKANNCDWFEIVEKNEMSRRDFAGFLGYVEKPRSAIVIKLFQKEPPTNAYSADDILKSIVVK